jgi:hypothetical protein
MVDGMEIMAVVSGMLSDEESLVERRVATHATDVGP